MRGCLHYVSLNIISGSVSPDKVRTLHDKLFETQEKTLSQDDTILSTLNREEILGDIMYSGTLSYFAQLQAIGVLSNQYSKGLINILSGEGTFGYEPNVDYLFGAPKTIGKGGIKLDIPILTANAITQTGNTTRKELTTQFGMLSSTLEHLVPEKMFSTDNYTINSISTMKAFEIASKSGQNIYKITKNNMNEILPKINHSSSVMNEIQISLNQGKEIVIHADLVTVPGWTGSGYMIIDPITGDGAYKIAGGTNGSFSKVVYMMLQIGSITTDIKAFLALQAGLENVAKILGRIAIFMGLAMIVLDVVDVIAACKDKPNLGDILVPYIMACIGMMAAAGVLLFAGPLAIIAGGIALQQLSSFLKADTLNRGGCI